MKKLILVAFSLTVLCVLVLTSCHNSRERNNVVEEEQVDEQALKAAQTAQAEKEKREQFRQDSILSETKAKAQAEVEAEGKKMLAKVYNDGGLDLREGMSIDDIYQSIGKDPHIAKALWFSHTHFKGSIYHSGGRIDIFYNYFTAVNKFAEAREAKNKEKALQHAKEILESLREDVEYFEKNLKILEARKELLKMGYTYQNIKEHLEEEKVKEAQIWEDGGEIRFAFYGEFKISTDDTWYGRGEKITILNQLDPNVISAQIKYNQEQIKSVKIRNTAINKEINLLVAEETSLDFEKIFQKDQPVAE